MNFSKVMWATLIAGFVVLLYFQINVFYNSSNHAKIEKNEKEIYRTFDVKTIVFRVNLMNDASADLFNNSERIFALENETYSITVVEGDVLSFYTTKVPQDRLSRVGFVEVIEVAGKKCNDLYELNYGITVIEKY